MGYSNPGSLTESGMKYISQCLLLQFCIILILMLSSIALIFSKDSSTLFIAFIFLELLIFILLILSLVKLYNGRNEFGSKHEYNIILSLILIAVYFFLSLGELILSGGIFGGSSIVSAAASGFSTSSIIQTIIVISLSIASRIFFGFALIYLISEFISEDFNKYLRKNVFYLLVLGPLTFEITGLLAIRSFYNTYRTIYLKIHEGKLKPAVTAPCPICNKDIPIESKVCPYCETEFEENPDMEIDPILKVEVPKKQLNMSPGYTPVKGPTEEEKKKVYRIITIIIAFIVIVAAAYLVLQIFSNEDKSSVKDELIGTWQGGMTNGSGYETNKIWIFFTNNSLKENDTFGVDWYTYYTEGDKKLCKEDVSISFLMCYGLELTNNGNTLSLSLGGSPMFKFNKVQ